MEGNNLSNQEPVLPFGDCFFFTWGNFINYVEGFPTINPENYIYIQKRSVYLCISKIDDTVSKFFQSDHQETTKKQSLTLKHSNVLSCKLVKVS